MTSFAGWNFFGQGAYMMNNQGVNIVINLFFGVTVNAARGIATQVNNAVNQFVANFMMALNPQITKSYASGELDEMHKLVYRGSKFSYFFDALFFNSHLFGNGDNITFMAECSSRLFRSICTMDSSNNSYGNVV